MELTTALSAILWLVLLNKNVPTLPTAFLTFASKSLRLLRNQFGHWYVFLQSVVRVKKEQLATKLALKYNTKHNN